MPWRSDTSMYAITVSELMLQQTQVPRVIPKFIEFTTLFPDFKTLAEAPQANVLRAWQGLGYNRRARYLHQAAQHIVHEWNYQIPNDQKKLTQLPGVGKNTAGAMCAYVFNAPVVYIETNIRTVYLHHFFSGQTNISDAHLMPHIKATLDEKNPRQFYWALMDYGAFLKKLHPNPSRNSKHYAKQSQFEGSLRQVRSRVLKQLITSSMTYQQLKQRVNDDRIDQVLVDLQKDQLIQKSGQRYSA